MQLKFRQLPGVFAVCRLPSNASIPPLPGVASFLSITGTADELSIVCAADLVPENAKCESPWVCFKLEGPFPFSLTGVLASFLDPLAKAGIPIFAVSTFDTDYVLVKEESAPAALKALRDAGHEFLA
jgi:uncharacterized protein